MAQATQPYKRSLSGSIGSGMKSVLGGNDRRFYVLEHKVSSQYHKAGESQRIIVDQIEIGRGHECQVRFDESFTTVSRRHAAIVKDGDNWKLVQLSQTNSTYLNGRRVEKEWYLQSGDEIQLSTNGPKLGFIVPQGEKGLVKSIGLTSRLNLFRQQALRPYKTAISVLSCVLVAALILGGWKIFKQQQIIENQTSKIAYMASDFQERIDRADEKRRKDSIENVRQLEAQKRLFEKEIADERNRTLDLMNKKGGSGFDVLIQEQNIYNDIFFLFTEKVVFVQNGKEIQIMSTQKVKDENGQTVIKKVPYGWSGTGFLMEDGRFVTARHCIEGWMFEAYNGDDEIHDVQRYIASGGDDEIVVYLRAVSSISKREFSFTNKDFVINHSMDKKAKIGVSEDGNPLYWIFPYPAADDWPDEMLSTDWAYSTKTEGQKGGLMKDIDLSQNLLPMQPLAAIGFPQDIGVNEWKQAVQPIASNITCSGRGLAKSGCILHSSGTDHGNSGGPIFAISGDKLVVVGIVSREDARSEQFNWAVPISLIYK